MKSMICVTAALAALVFASAGCASSGKFETAPARVLHGLDFNGPVDYTRSNPETHPQSDKVVGAEKQPDVIVAPPEEKPFERIKVDVAPVKRPIGPYMVSVWFGTGADTTADPFAQPENLMGPGGSFEYEAAQLDVLLKFSVNVGASLFFLTFKDYGGTTVNGNTNLYEETSTRMVLGLDLFAEAMVPLDQYFNTDFALYVGMKQTFTHGGNHVHPDDGMGYMYGFGYYFTDSMLFRAVISTEREHYMVGLGFQF
jgi:hypothetical protein